MSEAFGKKLCLDNLQRNEDQPYNLGQYPCHPTMAMSQVKKKSEIVQHVERKAFNFPFPFKCFSLSKQGQLRREESCAEVLDPHSAEAPVKMMSCSFDLSEGQTWILTEVHCFAFSIRHGVT